MRAVTPLLLAVVLCIAGQASANTQIFPEILRGGSVYRNAVARERAHHQKLGFFPNSTPSYFYPPVDHWDASLGTFKDKFYYDTTYWDESSGPCMFYLNGETGLEQAVGGYMAEIAKSLNACTVAIEHRWYGSSPAGSWSNKTLFTETLNIKQAMADVMALREYFETNIAKRNVTWMLVGGSYSGAMTVWLNEAYPGKWKASWAASGVVKATLDFFEYDAHIKSVITQDCFTALQTAFRYAAILWETPSGRQTLFNLFEPGAENITKAQFFNMMSFAYESSVQYSQRTLMCNSVLPLELDDPMAMLTRYAFSGREMWGPRYTRSCRFTPDLCTAEAAAAGLGFNGEGNSWFWQVCSEFGWWQIGFPGGIKPINVSTALSIESCRAVFYPDTFPDVWAFNQKWHGLHPQTQGYIVATQGSDDPWSTTGLSVSQGPNFPVNTAQCTDCGHCGSMMAPRDVDPQALKDQRTLVMQSLSTWMAR
uniref:Serine carboxypeptidase S28 n=1 Tax=Neobodo designis TaxID=312471 RepID=A0A7S1R1F5_NEODS